eukprot:4073277-Amphidinium_carterae.1
MPLPKQHQALWLAATAVIIAVLVGTQKHAAPVAETRFGTVTGHRKELRTGLACEEFLGIPYAVPPRRFQPPVPWSEDFPGFHFEAKTLGSPCVQVDPHRLALVG